MARAVATGAPLRQVGRLRRRPAPTLPRAGAWPPSRAGPTPSAPTRPSAWSTTTASRTRSASRPAGSWSARATSGGGRRPRRRRSDVGTRPSACTRSCARELAEWMVYGVFRSDAVAATRPFAMPGVEDALCAELVLRGPVLSVPEVLFDHRLHAAQRPPPHAGPTTSPTRPAPRPPAGRRRPGAPLEYARAVARVPMTPGPPPALARRAGPVRGRRPPGPQPGRAGTRQLLRPRAGGRGSGGEGAEVGPSRSARRPRGRLVVLEAGSSSSRPARRPRGRLVAPRDRLVRSRGRRRVVPVALEAVHPAPPSRPRDSRRLHRGRGPARPARGRDPRLPPADP